MTHPITFPHVTFMLLKCLRTALEILISSNENLKREGEMEKYL
jgi:hypothetical protein